MISTARAARASFLVTVLGSLVSCAEPQAASPAPALPTAAATTAPPAPAPAPPAVESPFAIKGPFRADLVPPQPKADVSSVVSGVKKSAPAWRKAVGALPASCKPYLEKAAKKPAVACDTFAPGGNGQASQGVAGLLVEALGVVDPAKRDEKLRELATCKGISEAELVALRAHLAPPECSDAIVEKLAESPAALAPLDKSLAHSIVGLWIAGQLARTVPAIPRMPPPFSKAAVIKFTNGAITTWFRTQAAAVDELSKVGASLEGQGRATVAIEAGLADMRFVERAREVPIPDEWKKDPEIAQVYQAALDQAMEPRKLRGRDAALTGLNDAASLGILQDARIERARKVLVRLYGGSRIDALDGLLMPPPKPQLQGATVLQLLATRLPLVTGERLVVLPPAEPATLHATSVQGLLPVYRAKEAATDATFERLAQLRLDLARLYFRGAEADQVLAMAQGRTLADDATRFYVALALALRHGPDGAARMMLAPSPAALDLRHTEALDVLAKETSRYAGIAAFDAAWLRRLSPPEGAGSEYFADVAKRFHEAEQKLESPGDKAKAREQAALADETAKAAH